MAYIGTQAHDEGKDLFEDIGKKNFVNFSENKIESRSEKIGKILKFLRKRMNLTQTTIANNIGIAQQTYAGYENGKHEPSIEIAIRLANFYGLSMDFITGRFAGFFDEPYYYDDLDNLDEILENSAAYYESIEPTSKQVIGMIKHKIDAKKE